MTDISSFYINQLELREKILQLSNDISQELVANLIILPRKTEKIDIYAFLNQNIPSLTIYYNNKEELEQIFTWSQNFINILNLVTIDEYDLKEIELYTYLLICKLIPKFNFNLVDTNTLFTFVSTLYNLINTIQTQENTGTWAAKEEIREYFLQYFNLLYYKDKTLYETFDINVLNEVTIVKENQEKIQNFVDTFIKSGDNIL